MTKYITLHTADKNSTELLNELAEFGWKLHAKETVRYTSNLEIIGRFDEDEDKPLVALTLVFDHNEEYAQELYDLSLKYIADKKSLSYVTNSSIGKLVTGLVFATILAIPGFIFLFMRADNVNADPNAIAAANNAFITLGIIFLFLSIPAFPLCIGGIVFKKKNEHKVTSKIPDEMTDLKVKARLLQK